MTNPGFFFYYKNETLYEYILNPITELLSQPLPWYVAGPLIGLVVPLLIFAGNKKLGGFSSLRPMVATWLPARFRFADYHWNANGLWYLFFVAGIFLGGFLGGYILPNPEPVSLSAGTLIDLSVLGISSFHGYFPGDIFNWGNLFSLQGFVMLMVGGFLFGFGARYAGSCGEGRTICGVTDFQAASIMASVGFLIGGLIITHMLFPFLF